MKRILSTLLSVQVRPQHWWVRPMVLFAFEGIYLFVNRASGCASILEGIRITFAGLVNPDQLIQSGRCRAT